MNPERDQLCKFTWGHVALTVLGSVIKLQFKSELISQVQNVQSLGQMMLLMTL